MGFSGIDRNSRKGNGAVTGFILLKGETIEFPVHLIKVHKEGNVHIQPLEVTISILFC